MPDKRLKAAVFLTVSASFAADLLTKQRALTHSCFVSSNSGISFGLLSEGSRAAIPPLSFLAVLLLLLSVIYFCRKQAKTESLASALMLGGALGNLYDRLQRGSVVDWFSAPFVSEISGCRLFMNAADVFIISGFAVLMLSFLRKTVCGCKKHK